MSELLAKIQVVSSAAVTWIVFASTALTIFSEEVASVLPDGGEDVTAFILKVVAWLGAAVAVIRRVSPVLPSQRGVLPPGA